MSKQLKISDLKRVVNVDEVTRLALILKDEKSDQIKIMNAIEQLSEKTPSKEILLKTKLGFILKDLTKRDDLNDEIKSKAKELRKKWKEFHKNLLLAQKLDVRCDKPTTEHRQNTRSSLARLFIQHVQSQQKPTNDLSLQSKIHDLEFMLFQYCDNLINQKYFSIVKRLTNLFLNEKTLIYSFINNEISTKDIIIKSIEQSK